MALPVTATYAGLMGLWLLVLAFVVMRRRRQHDISTGDGGVRELELAMRAHGNACKYVPIALILLGLAEGMGAPSWLLHVSGLSLAGGRALHGHYFLAGAQWLNERILGMLLTVGVVGALAIGLVLHGLAGIL